MNASEALRRLEILLLEVTGVEHTLDPSMDLRSSGILDSLDTMMFLLALEEQEGIAVDDSTNLWDEGSMPVAALVTILSTQTP